MKKILTLVLCLAMVLTLATVFASCGKADYKLGMGVVVSMDSSADNNAQVDATVAAVVTDEDGKIVLCRIDVAQNKMDVTAGAVKTDAIFKTKMEKGSEYGMAAAKVDANDDGVTKEWDEQAKAFEEFVVGKTVADIKAMTTAANKIGYQMTTDADLLAAGCSMQITDFIAAVVKACEDEQGMSFTAKKGFTLGVAAKTAVDKETKAATADAEGTVAMYTDFAAAVVADDAIIATLNDAIQPKINMDVAGTITKKDFTATKRELKEDYNMAKFGAKMDPNGDGKVLEWYVQSAEFSKFVVGKTAAEVAAMETAANSIGYQMTTDADLLAAGCTMQITGIKAVVAQSATNAR